MQIKTTMNYHLTLSRVAVIKIGTLVHRGQECKIVQPLYIKTAQRVFKKLKRTTIWSGNPTSERSEIRISKKYLHSHVHGSIIHNSQDWETT